MLALLAALSARTQQWRYGYDLMKETGLQSGTLYPLLMRMADQELVEAEWHAPERPGLPARHAYRLTATGAVLAREATASAQISGGRVATA
ncbi:PadR family transcriptional regulator [Sphingomonas sp. Leaf67]|uniref:PadR family transcriptional regulator n=1 Tax=Sphingomonas sp. Leaf67 TaxID=1736230 RepID=UPI0009E73CF6|nr:PadR family transcriptional regulator [Sphingomonas sp. Leaf67]